MKKTVLILGMLLTLAAVGAEQMAMIPRMKRVDIKLDGVADEKFWEEIIPIESFRKYRKKEQPTAKTSVKICLDDKNLYMAINCEEPVKVVTGTPGVGSAWSSDGVEIFFGSLEGKEWFRQIVFGLNGVMYTEFIEPGDMQKAFRNSSKEWSAELIIPLEKLGKITGDTMLFNMFRHRVGGREMQTIADLLWALEMDTFMTLKLYTPKETVIYGPWSTQVTAGSAVVCWESAGVCRTGLEYRKKGSDKFIKAAADVQSYVQDRAQKLHVVKLKNLEADTVYEYRINGEENGEFRTLAPEKADFSFLAVGDTHGNSREFTAMLNQPHAKKAELLIHLGDTISGVIGRGNYYEGFLEPIVKNWQKPYFVARGNHEGRGNAPGLFLDMVYPAGRKAYQGFLYKGVYFVILDTNDEFDSDPEFREEQGKWLLETVSGKEFREAEYRVLISHYSLNLNKAVGIRLAELWNKLPQEVRDSFDLSLAGHHHCFIKVLPGAKVMESDHMKYKGVTVYKEHPFLRLINYKGGTISVEKSSSELKVNIFNAEHKYMETVKIPRKGSKR